MTLFPKPSLPQSLLALAGLGAIAYTGTCLYLYSTQRDYLYSPNRELWRRPSSPEFQLRYDEFRIPVDPRASLHAWWIPAPSAPLVDPLPNEPERVIQGKTLLYFYGRGGNKSASGLARAQALHQLGFSVLLIDYRGFGASDGDQPSEALMYEDSEVAWDYLVRDRQISPDDIVIYGESMGGAVAINLAINHPEAHALIAQSTFTAMTHAVQLNPLLRLLPLDWILTDKFDSLAKLPHLQVPVLFIHGAEDLVVPSWMSEQLYAAAPVPKALHLIPGAGHFRLYRPGADSYLKAIAQFLAQPLVQPLAQPLAQPPLSQPRTQPSPPDQEADSNFRNRSSASTTRGGQRRIFATQSTSR